MTLWFPTTLIALDLGAAFVYLCYSDYRRAIYWAAAAILTGAITF
jgi:hypothetical protein